MDPQTPLMRGAKAAAGALGNAVRTVRRTPVARISRAVVETAERPVRYVRAAAPGLAYQYAGRKPDPGVSDDILADRVRAALGPVTKRLDLPRMHVMVEDHVVILRGEVNTEADARMIEAATMRVSGVIGVESHLHVGLISSDTRPSAGREHPKPSDGMLALCDAAASAGAHDARAAVHAVLCGFADRLPAGEREHVLAQLPEDVRMLAGPPQRIGVAPTKIKTVRELVAAVIAEGGIQPSRAGEITRAVVGRLRELVPSEERDVAGVLPEELRVLWESAPVG